MPYFLQKMRKVNHEPKSTKNNERNNRNRWIHRPSHRTAEKSYLTIGKLFVYNDGGMSLKLDVMPTNGQNINFYDIKPKNQNNNNQAPQQQPNNNYGGNGYQQNQPQGQNQNGYS